MIRVIKSALWVFFWSILILAVPRLAGLLARTIDYSAIDPDSSFAFFTVRHIIQMLVFIVIIIIIKSLKPISFGFGWGNKEIGRKYVLKFTLIFTAGALVMNTIFFLLNSYQPFEYPLNATNVAGQLGFQLLLSGPSEELIFRAFAITILALAVRGRIFKGKVSIANIIAAVIFGLAHLMITYSPLEISYYPMQITMSIVLGLFYGDCYEKSGSVYYPMLMHSISNVVMVGLTIILTYFMTR